MQLAHGPELERTLVGRVLAEGRDTQEGAVHDSSKGHDAGGIEIPEGKILVDDQHCTGLEGGSQKLEDQIESA